MAGAALLTLLALLLPTAAQDVAAWARLDRLLPSALQDTLPALLRLVGDLCELPGVSVGGHEWYVVEHSAAGRKRYPAARAKARLRAAAPGRLAVYAGGWGNSPGDEAARGIVGALLEDYPVVLELDTGTALGDTYTSAAARVPDMAAALHGLLRAAAAAGVAPGRVHVVGFSLGAHAAGAAARRLRAAGAGRMRAAGRAAGAGRVGRLTALDPARPCFTQGEAARRWRLARGDARFVHVVHSSAGGLGLARPLGHVDVYARGAGRGAAAGPGAAAGRGAAGIARAHRAAWRLWAASARTPLPARRCTSAAELDAGTCSGDVQFVGYSCSPNIRGTFLLPVTDVS